MVIVYLMFGITVLQFAKCLEMPSLPGLPNMPSMPNIPDIPNPDVTRALQTCRAKLQVTPADIIAITQQEIPTTKTGICLVACIQKEKGIIDVNNKYNIDGIRKQLKPMQSANRELYEATIEAFTDCADAGANEPDECGAYKKMHACLREKKTEVKDNLEGALTMMG